MNSLYFLISAWKWRIIRFLSLHLFRQGSEFAHPFFKIFFLLKTQKPLKSLINRAFSAVKIFLKFFFFDCKKAKNRL